MCDFSHFHTTLHHPTLLYVTLHFSMLLTLHCWLFSLLYNTFSLCTTLQHHFVYAPECFSAQRKDVEAAGYSSTSECIRSGSRPESIPCSLLVCLRHEFQRLVGYALEQLFTVTLFFHRGQLAASHRKRKSVQACDLKLGQTLSDESAVLKSLQETQEQMAAEAKHSETIARQRKRKVIREVPEVPRRQRRIRWDRQSQLWSELSKCSYGFSDIGCRCHLGVCGWTCRAQRWKRNSATRGRAPKLLQWFNSSMHKNTGLCIATD